MTNAEKNSMFVPEIMHLIPLLAVSTVAQIILWDETNALQSYALQWFLLPFIGSVFSSVCASLLNPKAENRKQVVARIIFGSVVGTALPKIVSMIHPSMLSLSVDPAIMFMSGFSLSMIAYIVSRPFIERLYGKAGDIGEAMAEAVKDRLEKKVVDDLASK